MGEKPSIKYVSNCQLLKATPMTITLLPACKLHLLGQANYFLICMCLKVFFKAPSQRIAMKFQVRVETKHHKDYMHTHTNAKLHFSIDYP